MAARDAGDGPGGVVVLYFVLAGSEVGGQRSELLDLRPVGGAAGVAAGDVHYVQFTFDPGGDAGGAPRQRIGARDPADPQDVLVYGREGRLADWAFLAAGILFILAGAAIAALIS